MSERSSQPKPPRQPAHVYRRRRLATATAGLLAVASGVVGTANLLDGATPAESRAAQAEAETLAEPRTADIRLILHEGVNLRHTPVRSNTDPDAGIKGNSVDFDIPEHATLRVEYPLQLRDKEGNIAWYGFALPRSDREPGQAPEEATAWVDVATLRTEEAEAADRGNPVNYYDVEQIRPLGMDMSQYEVQYDPSQNGYVASGLALNYRPQNPDVSPPTTQHMNRSVAAAVLVQQ